MVVILQHTNVTVKVLLKCCMSGPYWFRRQRLETGTGGSSEISYNQQFERRIVYTNLSRQSFRHSDDLYRKNLPELKTKKITILRFKLESLTFRWLYLYLHGTICNSCGQITCVAMFFDQYKNIGEQYELATLPSQVCVKG